MDKLQKLPCLSDKALVKITFLPAYDFNSAFCVEIALASERKSVYNGNDKRRGLRRVPSAFFERSAMMELRTGHPHEECGVFGLYDPAGDCAPGRPITACTPSSTGDRKPAASP